MTVISRKQWGRQGLWQSYDHYNVVDDDDDGDNVGEGMKIVAHLEQIKFFL